MTKLSAGDKVVVSKGDQKGVKGTITDISDVNVSVALETGASVFHASFLKKINSFEEGTPKGSEEYRTSTADRLRKRYEKKEVQEGEYIRRRTPQQRFAKAKFDAKRRSSGEKEFSLTFDEYSVIISKKCEYCNSDISQEAGSGLDRIDNEKGYVAGNVNPCCASCNRRRSKSMSAEDFKEQTRLNGYWKD